MIVLSLNRKSKTSLSRQVFTEISEMIENNTLPPGTKLPSSRILAEKHGVSRNVVYNAYEELWGQGYVDSRPGSYTVVRKKTPGIQMTQREEKGLIDWNNAVSLKSKEVYDIISKYPRSGYPMKSSDIIDMSTLDLDHRVLPYDDFRKCINTVIVKQPYIFNYGEPEGYFPLRSFISSRLQTHGIHVSPEEILITNGTQHSLDLTLRLLGKPGSVIVTENPTYFLAFPLFQFYQTEIISVSMSEEGINLRELEKTMRSGNVSFVYTTPNFHNPTGITMSPEVRENLVRICEKYHVPIVEDAFEEEMKYFGRVPLSIKSMDKNQIVIYMSSFSKVLFPGVRIGWIAADKDFIKIASAVKKTSDLATNSIIQSALFEFCRQGYYEIHIKRMNRIYKKRMQTALNVLKNELSSDHISWSEPLGGYLIWLKLSRLNISEEELHGIFKNFKINVAPGSLYFNNQPADYFIRISISQLNEDEIIEGLKRLKNALAEIYQKWSAG
ncbi:PLP-dependent aminotransferase family protein [candidate division KSB1 bacterium]